jgi:hypothetical protein
MANTLEQKVNDLDQRVAGLGIQDKSSPGGLTATGGKYIPPHLRKKMMEQQQQQRPVVSAPTTSGSSAAQDRAHG